MNTPSHFLITAALDKSLPRVPIVKSAFLFGSIAPDLPLWFLSIFGIGYYHFIQGWSLAETSNFVFDELFFHDPIWIISHNLLHSPLLLAFAFGYLWRSRRNIGSVERWLFWFVVACLIHAAIDVLTHNGDGPLLLFPLEWTLRFHSPVSYWNPLYYGREFARLELGLDVVLLVYLFGAGLCRMLRSWFRARVINF